MDKSTSLLIIFGAVLALIFLFPHSRSSIVDLYHSARVYNFYKCVVGHTVELSEFE